MSEQTRRSWNDRPTYTANEPSGQGDITALAEVTKRRYPSITISARSWWDLRRRFRQSIPGRVDADFLQSALGVGERRAKNVIAQLKALGMIDETGVPSDLAIQWRDNAGYTAACRRMMSQTYPQGLRDDSPPPAPDRGKVEEWFVRNGNVGKDAAARMAAFYCLLAAADPRAQRAQAANALDTPRAPIASRRAAGDGKRPRPAAGPFGEPSIETPPSSEEVSTEPSYARARNRYVVRRWRVVVISMVVGGIAGFLLASSAPDVYVAQGAVIASDTTIAPDQLGVVTETAFSTDEVLQPVIDRLGLDATPASLLASGVLEARSVSGGPALLISGRAADPQLAAELANAATASFVAIAEQKGLGDFASFEGAGPGRPEPHQAGLLVLLGILAGAGISLLVLVTMFFLRDPVVTEERARMDLHADAAFRLRVRQRRSLDGEGEHPEDDAFDVWPRAALVSVGDTIRERAQRDGRGACAVIVGGGDGEWAAAGVARELESRVVDQASWHGRSNGFSVSSRDPRFPEILESRDAIVAIVVTGSPRRSLLRVDDELHGLGIGFRIVVLVEPSR